MVPITGQSCETCNLLCTASCASAMTYCVRRAAPVPPLTAAVVSANITALLLTTFTHATSDETLRVALCTAHDCVSGPLVYHPLPLLQQGGQVATHTHLLKAVALVLQASQ